MTRTTFPQIDHSFKRRAKFTAHVQFIVLDKVPHNLVPVNPLGLTISYLREDQAFMNDDDHRSTAAISPQQMSGAAYAANPVQQQ